MKLTACFNAVSVSDFLSLSIYSVLNYCVLSSSKNRILVYLLQTALDHQSCNGVVMKRSRSQWKLTHRLELKRISSAAVRSSRDALHTNLVEFRSSCECVIVFLLWPVHGGNGQLDCNFFAFF